MNDDVQNKLIDDYLQGNLSKEARIDFKKQLFADPELAEKVKINKNLFALFNKEEWEDITRLNPDGIAYQEYLLSDEAQKLKEAINGAQKKYKQTTISPFKRFRWYGAAASLVLLVALSYNVITNQSGSSEELYAQYGDITDLPSLTLRSDGDKLLSEAEQLFHNKEYLGALNSLELYDEKYNNPPVIDILLYKGVCHLELGEFNKAKSMFNLLKNSNSLDKNKAYWYLALTNLKQKDIATTKKMLNIVVDNTYYNHIKAHQLLSKLN